MVGNGILVERQGRWRDDLPAATMLQRLRLAVHRHIRDVLVLKAPGVFSPGCSMVPEPKAQRPPGTL